MAVQLGGAYGKIDIDTAGAMRNIGGLGGALRGLGGGLSGALFDTSNFVNVWRGGAQIVGMGTRAVAGLGRAMWDATMDSADLSSQISAIGAVGQLTGDQLSNVGELISELGLDPHLKVDAQGAADAIEMLMRNGMSYSDVMDGAARSTVLLANATGAEFAPSADVATDAMAIFGLEATQMGAAVDGISGVTNASKFDLGDYALALSQGGAAAAVAGLELEDFNASITAISPYFASGSDAGTSFKTMLQRLIPQSNEAADAMQALGLEFFNADGTMKGMTEIAGELNQALYGQVEFTSVAGGRTEEQTAELNRLGKQYKNTMTAISDYSTGVKGAGLSEEKRAEKLAELNTQLGNIKAQMEPLGAIQGELVRSTRELSEEERLSALNTIFGTDAMRAAAAMAKYTDEEMAALYETLAESDAEEQAALRMDNLAGDMDIFRGQVDTLRLEMGSKFEPALRGLFQGLGGVMSDMTPALTDVASALGKGLEAALPGLQAFAEAVVVPKLEALAENLSNAAANLPAATQAFTDAGGGVTGFKAAVDLLAADDSAIQGLSDLFSAEETAAIDTYGASMSGLLTTITSSMEGINTSFDKESQEFTADFGSWAASWNAVGLTKLQIGDLIDLDFESQKPALQQLADQIAPEFEGMLRDKLGLDVDLGKETPAPWGLELPVTPVVGEPEVEFMENWQLPVTAVVESVTVTGGASGFGLEVPATPVWTAMPTAGWGLGAVEVPAVPVFSATPTADWGMTPIEVPATPVFSATPAAGWGVVEPVETEAQISDVLWGTFTNIYNVSASVSEQPVWGGYSTIYDVQAAVTSEPDWGNYTHEYSATVRVIEVSESGESRSSGGFGGTSKGKAVGTSYWGGGATLVGERGPELMVPPRGASILTNGQSVRARDLAGGGQGGQQTINVVLERVTVNGEMDVDDLAWRLGRKLARFVQ